MFLPDCCGDVAGPPHDTEFQVRDYVELSELRRVVLGMAAVELGTLIREEAARPHAAPPRPAPDSATR
jgi:hypothetical protein